MEKFIPYEKLSKEEKRRIDEARRQTWGELNPVTRNPKTVRLTTERNHRHGSGNCRLLPVIFLSIIQFLHEKLSLKSAISGLLHYLAAIPFWSCNLE